MIDSHVHLHEARYEYDLLEVIERDRAAGVTHYILPDDSSSTRDALERLARKYSFCFPCIGAHPLEMNDNPNWKNEVQMVVDKLKEGALNYVAIGETGLDMHWSKDFLKEQIVALHRHLELAIEYALPVILHIREAWEEVLPVLAQYKGEIRGVAHSFAGTFDNYLALRELGEYSVGISGPITYKNSHLPQAVAQIPLEHILLETDGPFLPPVPHRGQRNESGYMRYISTKIAEVKGISQAEVENVATANTIKLFGLNI